jgi:hypothetical protein
MTCIQNYIREVTLNFDDEDISIWGGWGFWQFMEEKPSDLTSAISLISELSREAGLVWDHGPFRKELLSAIDLQEQLDLEIAFAGSDGEDHQCIIDPEHESALVEWREGPPNMDDLHEPSYFNEWDQSTGRVAFVCDARGIAQKFNPEMLLQRHTLNCRYNFEEGRVLLIGKVDHIPVWINEKDIVHDTTELLELISVGDNHGVAKSQFGAVFVPKGAINYLKHNGGATVGTIFDGEITFTSENKFPWRLKRDGVK